MISFAITTHNEGEYIQSLLGQLVPYCLESGDEIVVVDDYSTDKFTNSILDAYVSDGSIKLHKHALNDHFADHKNFLTEQCSGEYIFQLDADEHLHDNLLSHIATVIEYNPQIDLFLVPRVNIVEGITENDIKKYRWQLNEHDWIMFPDYQTRIYRNHPDIRWINRVHERIVGYNQVAELPPEEEWSIYHIKTIERQRAQNEYYATL